MEPTSTNPEVQIPTDPVQEQVEEVKQEPVQEVEQPAEQQSVTVTEVEVKIERKSTIESEPGTTTPKLNPDSKTPETTPLGFKTPEPKADHDDPKGKITFEHGEGGAGTKFDHIQDSINKAKRDMKARGNRKSKASQRKINGNEEIKSPAQPDRKRRRSQVHFIEQEAQSPQPKKSKLKEASDNEDVTIPSGASVRLYEIFDTKRRSSSRSSEKKLMAVRRSSRLLSKSPDPTPVQEIRDAISNGEIVLVKSAYETEDLEPYDGERGATRKIDVRLSKSPSLSKKPSLSQGQPQYRTPKSTKKRRSTSLQPKSILKKPSFKTPKVTRFDAENDGYNADRSQSPKKGLNQSPRTRGRTSGGGEPGERSQSEQTRRVSFLLDPDHDDDDYEDTKSRAARASIIMEGELEASMVNDDIEGPVDPNYRGNGNYAVYSIKKSSAKKKSYGGQTQIALKLRSFANMDERETEVALDDFNMLKEEGVHMVAPFSDTLVDRVHTDSAKKSSTRKAIRTEEKL